MLSVPVSTYDLRAAIFLKKSKSRARQSRSFCLAVCTSYLLVRLKFELELCCIKIPLIDLRVLCDDDKDFANPIEPSCIGGMKIAKTINKITNDHNFESNSCEVYV